MPWRYKPYSKVGLSVGGVDFYVGGDQVVRPEPPGHVAVLLRDLPDFEYFEEPEQALEPVAAASVEPAAPAGQEQAHIPAEPGDALEVPVE